MDKKYEDLPVEVPHPTDPAHKLKLVRTTEAFVCDGCNEPGDGPRYTSADDADCGSRNSSIRLHTSCALAGAATPLQHHLFPGMAFVFLPKPPPPVDETVCDACGEPARGFVYHCYEGGTKGGLDVHPCCWSLQPTITTHGEPKPLELCNSKASRHCALCGKKGRRKRFWAYCCYDANDDRHVYLHVACVIEAARRAWDEDYHERVGGGGGIVRASMPAIEAAVQKSLARNARSSRGGFARVMKIVTTVAQIVIAAIFGNPLGMISALVGPGGFFLQG
ncbi:unnamed protein product [Urochloa decumbens]|uniref:DC1 domain-containing protein n=1 Tax=Urochloa decumbens TaxID=240449 RepID=A0ABC9C407_9POAL